MTNKWHTDNIELNDPIEAVPVRILKHSGVAHAGVTGGMVVPVLHLDVADRPDIRDLVRLHALDGEGECHTQWGRSDGNILLVLKFAKPARCVVLLAIDRRQQAAVVDQILRAGTLMLVATTQDELVPASELAETAKIVVEVTRDFEAEWNRIWTADLKAEGFSPAEVERLKNDIRDAMNPFGGEEK